MRLLLPISVSLLLLTAWQTARAQLAPADDFFNGGAQLYISNNIPSALNKVEDGLKIYPDDEKLKKLEALLKQQQQQNQQNQQQQNQQNQSQQQKSNDQKNQQQQKQNSQDQQKQDEQKQSQEDQKKADEQKQQQQQSAAQKNEGEKPDQQNAEGQPIKPGEMTPEEAKRLLDAQKGNEQILQFKPQGKPQDDQHPVKDW